MELPQRCCEPSRFLFGIIWDLNYWCLLFKYTAVHLYACLPSCDNFLMAAALFSGVIGSGVCVFSKCPILETFFHPFLLNGHVYKVQHFDWFGGKGIGLCKLLFNGFRVNLYATHVSHCGWVAALSDRLFHCVL